MREGINMEPWAIMVIVIIVIVIIIAVLYFSGLLSGTDAIQPNDPEHRPVNLSQVQWELILSRSDYVETYKGYAISHYEEPEGDLQYYWIIDSTGWFRTKFNLYLMRNYIDALVGD